MTTIRFYDITESEFERSDYRPAREVECIETDFKDYGEYATDVLEVSAEIVVDASDLRVWKQINSDGETFYTVELK